MSDARWAGRHVGKDALRDRVWTELEESGAAVGPARSRIPDFLGAGDAADRLTILPEWNSARVVKTNPDRGQAPVRLRALQAGKKLYSPVPELVMSFPFVELDPTDLQRRGIAFEDVIYSEDFVRLGKPVEFDEMDELDLVVVGCVAVTAIGGRTGKGGGFADLELGIFRELGIVDDSTPVVTTVHDLQVVPDSEIVMVGHDYPLDHIFTPTRSIATSHSYPKPTGVAWDVVEQDQFDGIPFLRSLRNNLTGGPDKGVGRPGR